MKIAIAACFALCFTAAVPLDAVASCDVCYHSCGGAGKPTCDSRRAACEACRTREASDREAAARARLKATPDYKAVQRYEAPRTGRQASVPAPAISTCREKSCAGAAR